MEDRKEKEREEMTMLYKVVELGLAFISLSILWKEVAE